MPPFPIGFYRDTHDSIRVPPVGKFSRAIREPGSWDSGREKSVFGHRFLGFFFFRNRFDSLDSVEIERVQILEEN